MKQILYSLLLILFAGCSTSNEDEPNYLQMDGLLYPHFSNTGASTTPIAPLDTIYIGKQYELRLYPCTDGEHSDIVKSVTYYLNNIEVGASNTENLTTNYTVGVVTGKYTLSCKPIFTSENIIWQPTSSEVVVLN